MKTAIILGTFDGLHAGHREVIKNAEGFYGIAVTFDIPPKSVYSQKTQLLILPQEREIRLKQLGIKQVVMQKFEQVKNISAEDYLENLKNEYNPSRIVCGFNYRFGHNALGDTDLLKNFCLKNGIEFICVPPVKSDGITVSSTYIRNLISEGKMRQASAMMYGGFAFETEVIHGDARGRELGFPTANQKYPTQLVCAKFGVYISEATICGKRYKAITNLGIRPTYRTNDIGCETYIKDFSGDIYHKKIKIELLDFVREEKRFNSLSELVNAIKNDVILLDGIN